MRKRNKVPAISVFEEKIISKIFLIRNQKVMLDRDLAEMYGVETKVLKQAVKRNRERFPKDFMFEMTEKELKNWRSQFVTSNSSALKGLRYNPFCFTEQGVAMLSSILNSTVAIKVNIQIIRVFGKMKEMLLSNSEILLKLEKLENDVKEDRRNVITIFEILRKLLTPDPVPRRRVGFRRTGEKD